MVDSLPSQAPPTDSRELTVFLSYAHADRTIALRFRDELVACGLDVLVDEKSAERTSPNSSALPSVAQTPPSV